MTGSQRFGRLVAAGAVLGTVGVLPSGEVFGEVFGGVANAAPAPVRPPAAAPTAVPVPAPVPGTAPLQVPQPDPEAAERQARARAEAAARAARAAAKRAEAARKVRLTWEKRGRPHRMAVVRTNRIDVVTDGRLTRQVGRGGGAITISTLDRALPSDWLAASDGVATLGATSCSPRGPRSRWAPRSGGSS